MCSQLKENLRQSPLLHYTVVHKVNFLSAKLNRILWHVFVLLCDLLALLQIYRAICFFVYFIILLLYILITVNLITFIMLSLLFMPYALYRNSSWDRSWTFTNITVFQGISLYDDTIKWAIVFEWINHSIKRKGHLTLSQLWILDHPSFMMPGDVFNGILRHFSCMHHTHIHNITLDLPLA